MTKENLAKASETIFTKARQGTFSRAIYARINGLFHSIKTQNLSPTPNYLTTIGNQSRVHTGNWKSARLVTTLAI
jgi:hypothetical protein